MKKILKVIIIIIISISCNPAFYNYNKEMLDSKAAIKIGKKALYKKYGKQILKNKPYSVKILKDSTWLVRGTSKKRFGDMPYVQISKNGEILKVFYLK